MRSALFALLALVWAATLGWAAELPGYREVPLGPPPLWLIRSPNDLELWAQMRHGLEPVHHVVARRADAPSPQALWAPRGGSDPKGTRQCCIGSTARKDGV